MTSEQRAPPSGSYSAATKQDLQALLDAVSGLAILIDLEDHILCVNAACSAHFGCPIEQLIGVDLFTLFDPSISNIRRPMVRKAVQQRRTIVREDERDGIHFRHRLAPVANADGTIRCVALFVEDITERKKAELTLRASEEKYRHLAENTSDTVWQLDEKMCLSFVNSSYCHLTGFAMEEIIGRPVLEFFTLEGQLTVMAMMAKRKEAEAKGRSHQSLRFEVPHIRKQGAPFWAEINSTPIYDDRGNIIAYNGILRDIDERKTIELALRASEERFRFMAENTKDVVWALTAELRFTYINGADERLRDIPREDVIGHPVWELFTAEGQAIVARAIAAFREVQKHSTQTQHLRFQAPQIRKDGSSYWTEVSATRILDAAGEVIGYNGITRDIDESKRYEQRLEEANRQLQTQIGEISALQAQLKEQAVRDPLTGLHNRRYLDETLPRELARAKRDSYPLSLISVDLDYFKRINDTYGHPAGDAVLKAVAALLTQGTRESDIVCRYGGEEFLVVLPNVPLEQALLRAQEWKQALNDAPIPCGSASIQVTLSAGISAFPALGSDMETLLRLADDALYQAKAHGRNRIEAGTP